MSWNTHRPRGRFFNGQKLEVMVWLLAAPLSWMMWLAVGVVQTAHAQTGPATTLVSDTRSIAPTVRRRRACSSSRGRRSRLRPVSRSPRVT
jgi:hypothetical protein